MTKRENKKHNVSEQWIEYSNNRYVRKRVYTVVMIVLLVFLSCFVRRNFKAYAETTIATREPAKVTDEDGTIWYEVGNKEELYWYANKVNSLTSANETVQYNLRLKDNIIVNANVVNQLEVSSAVEAFAKWEPIGTGCDFAGTIDGQGYSISGLYLGENTYTNVGLVAATTAKEINKVTYMGTIKNLSIKDSYFHSGPSNVMGNVGGIVGKGYGIRMSGCSFQGTIAAEGTMVAGGLIGSATGYPSKNIMSKVNDSFANVTIYAGNRSGGLIGINNGYVDHCYVTGEISSEMTQLTMSPQYFIGGLTGSNGGQRSSDTNYTGFAIVSNCYSNMKLSTKATGVKLGGLTGWASGGYFVNCYSSGDNQVGIGQTQADSGSTHNNYYYTYMKDGITYEDHYDVCYNCYYESEHDISSDQQLAYNETPYFSEDTFASGKVAYLLNRPDHDKVYQRLGMEPAMAFGQRIGTDATPRFFTSTKDNTVFQITYQGEYEDTAYCNQTATLPVCEEAGYRYAFTYADTSKAGEAFTGENIESNAKVTVTKVGTMPSYSNDGGILTFTIKTPEQMEWFSDYVNGVVNVPVSEDGEDALNEVSARTHANAVLANDIDLSEQDMNPIGWCDDSKIAENEQYQFAYKGHFDGRYHVIKGYSYVHTNTVTANKDYAGLFGVTYGARIERLGLENATIKGGKYVGSICGKAVATKVISCYSSGSLVATGNFAGGIIGYGDIAKEGTISNLNSQSLATEVYRCYYSGSMGISVLSDTWAGGISGGNGAAVTIGEQNYQVTYANCYYDKEKASSVAGAIYGLETLSRASDDVENQVQGMETKAFANGKVTWYLQQAAQQLGDTNITPGEYKASDSLTGTNGLNAVTYQSMDLIWCQKVSDRTLPAFAEYENDAKKEEKQVIRCVAVNVTEYVSVGDETAEWYGNKGLQVTPPSADPVIPLAAVVEGREYYFDGWSFTPYDAMLTATLGVPVTATQTVDHDCYLYAWYVNEGKITITNQQLTAEYTYGTGQGTRTAIGVTATCNMSKASDYLSYQWYEKVNEANVAAPGGGSSSFTPALTLSAGTHTFFCRVTAKNGMTKDSQSVVVTILPKQLTEALFTISETCYYTMNPCTPELTPVNSERDYLSSEDYEMTYENNVERCTLLAPAYAVVTANAGGNYTGSVRVPFVIEYYPGDTSMYSLTGEQDEEGIYIDSALLKPTQGYEMSFQTNEKSFGEEGTKIDAVEDVEQNINRRVVFHIRQKSTGYITGLMAVQLSLKQKNPAVTTQKPPTTEPQATTEDGSTKTTESPSTTQKRPTAEKQPATTRKPATTEASKKPSSNSFFDGFGQPKVGRYYNIGNYRYRVTKSGITGGTVTLYQVRNRRIKSANLPAYVNINGYHYLVTAIWKKAFYKCSKLTKVVVCNNVKVIGDYAFAACPKLSSITMGKKATKIGKYAFYKDRKCKKITLRSGQLKYVGKNALKGMANKAIIKVPKKYKSRYKKLFRSKGLKKYYIR